MNLVLIRNQTLKKMAALLFSGRINLKMRKPDCETTFIIVFVSTIVLVDAFIAYRLYEGGQDRLGCMLVGLCFVWAFLGAIDVLGRIID